MRNKIGALTYTELQFQKLVHYGLIDTCSTSIMSTFRDIGRIFRLQFPHEHVQEFHAMLTFGTTPINYYLQTTISWLVPREFEPKQSRKNPQVANLEKQRVKALLTSNNRFKCKFRSGMQGNKKPPSLLWLLHLYIRE